MARPITPPVFAGALSLAALSLAALSLAALSFVASPSRAQGPPPDPSDDRSPYPEDEDPDDEVVEIYAEERKKTPPSVTSLNRSEVRRLPGAFGDPFRAVEVMPGVTPIISGLPFFYVRGAPPGNVGYFLDGVRVPYLFHIGAGPAVIHPALVERVDLYAGGYPARLGRFAGGIVSAEVSEPNPDWHGEGSVRLIDAGALVEGGFSDGRVTALVAGRYSYSGAILSLVSPNVNVDYRDVQARASVDLGDDDRISVFAFGSYDFLSDTREARGDGGSSEKVETVLFGSEFYRVDGRYDARFDGGGKLRAAVTWGLDNTRIVGTRNSRNMLVGSRVGVEQPLSNSITLRGGFDMQIDQQSADELRYVDSDDPFVKTFNDQFPARSDTGVAAWADVTWRPDPALEITPGVRIDTYYSGLAKAVGVDPRLSLVVHASDGVRLLHAVGVAHQPPSFLVPVPGLSPANLGGGLQVALQASSGIEIELPWHVTATFSGYAAMHSNMTDTLGAAQDLTAGDVVPRSQGGSKGLEIYIRRSLSQRIGGFVAYTLSRTTRSVDGRHFKSAYDRPHVLHAAVGYNLGRGWKAGARTSLYSGTPNNPGGELAPDQPARDPLFYRVDFRVEKMWTIFERGWLSFVTEMVNATLNRETIDGEQLTAVVVPSIGVEGGF